MRSLRRPGQRRLVLGLGGAALVLPVVAWNASCAGNPRVPSTPVPVPAPADVAWTLLLAGDAGAPAPGDPVLRALTQAAGVAPARTTVVFLGDNVYPAGLPDSGTAARPEAERRLAEQIEVVTRSRAHGFFVPGNHDWAGHAEAGWDAIRRQGRWIQARSGGTVELLPAGGCPGPDRRDVGPVFRLVFLDTQWWLHGHAKPADPTSSCPADSDAEVTALLRNAVHAPAGREVIVVAHHPLISGGEHGGHFGLSDHLFPLRNVASWLWLPLPILGSIYPIARARGISRQDLSDGRYRAMRAGFAAALRADSSPPLIFASGHEHNLQVHDGAWAELPARWLLISGAGYFDHTSRTVWLGSTRFAARASGFMRVDALTSGRVRLGVLRVGRDGRAVEAFSLWLR